MSLPTTLFFLDEEGNQIKEVPFNVGWVMRYESLAYRLMETIIENKGTFQSCNSIMVYNYIITKDFIVKCKDYPDFEKKLIAYCLEDDIEWRKNHPKG